MQVLANEITKNHKEKGFGVPHGGWKEQLQVAGALGPKASGSKYLEKESLGEQKQNSMEQKMWDWGTSTLEKSANMP